MNTNTIERSESALAGAESATAYYKAGGDYHSSVNQRIVGKLVEREVSQCFSYGFSTLEALAAESSSDELDYEEMMNLCRLAPDYEEEGRQQGWIPSEEATAKDIDEFLELESITPSDFAFICAKTMETSDSDSWEELAEEQGFDSDAQDNAGEVFEHWIVSNWIAGELSERGQPTGEVLGLTIWGRGTTGQSILLDWVFCDIAASMGILEGQRNSWAD